MLRRKPSNASEKEQVQKKKLTLQRSSSFKDFMKHKPTSPVVSEKEFTLEEDVTDSVPAEEAGKGGSKLGKKWRNVISRTMTRKTSKMVQKVLAEEGGEIGEATSPISTDWLPDLSAGQRTSVCSSGSEDTMPSPISRQLSGSSDRQSLDSGYCQRDSMRLEENGVSYTGPFCGRAVVHTDFTPSPYDLESLKLQKGDIIHIIEKPPVGTWTGKLNNKVGSFKFIYVNLLPDESPPARRRRCNSRAQRVKSKPKSLEEVLDSIGLTELSSLLSMHGFQSLEDFAGLAASHLNELNITDPEQRSKILNASELLRDSEDESEAEEEENRSAEEAKEPRDSGCFESSENLESGREEVKKEEELQSGASEEQTDEGAEEHELETEEEEKQTEQPQDIEEQLEEVQEQTEEVQEQLEEEVQEQAEEVQEQQEEEVQEQPEEVQEQQEEEVQEQQEEVQEKTAEEVQEQLEEAQEQAEEVQEQLEEEVREQLEEVQEQLEEEVPEQLEEEVQEQLEEAQEQLEEEVPEQLEEEVQEQLEELKLDEGC